jgi:hypothetical protein
VDELPVTEVVTSEAWVIVALAVRPLTSKVLAPLELPVNVKTLDATALKLPTKEPLKLP